MSLTTLATDMTDHIPFDADAARQLTKAATLDIERAYQTIMDEVKLTATSGSSKVITPFPTPTMSRTQAEALADRIRKAGFNAAVTDYGPQYIAIETSW